MDQAGKSFARKLPLLFLSGSYMSAQGPRADIGGAARHVLNVPSTGIPSPPPSAARKHGVSATPATVRCAHLETVKPSPADWTLKVLTGTAVAGLILDGTSNALE